MPDKQLFTFRKPVGTVAVITAGNFPVAVPSWYIVPALLCRQHDRLEAGRVLRGRLAPRSTSCSSAAAGCPTGCSTSCTPTAPATFAGLEQVAGGRPDRQGRLHRLVGGRPGDRRADRPAPADRLPGARRQEPAGRHPQRRPRPRGRGRAVLRVRHGRPALHVARHGDRATSRSTTSSSARFNAAVARRPGRRPDPGRADGPDAGREVRRAVTRSILGWIQPHHAVQARATAGSRADNPRDGFVGDPAAGLFYHPVVVDGVRPGDQIFDGGDLRAASSA